MNSPNYINHYVNVLTETMNDAVGRNVSLTAQGRVNDEIIVAQETKIQNLEAALSEKIQLLNSMKGEIGVLRSFEGDYKNVKHQADHLEIFRNELIKAREENEMLKEQIALMSMTPAEKKKYEKEKAEKIAAEQAAAKAAEEEKLRKEEEQKQQEEQESSNAEGDGGTF